MKGTIKKISNQEGRFIIFLRPLVIAGLPLIKYVLTPLAKSVLIPLGLTAASASATDAASQTKNFVLGRVLDLPPRTTANLKRINGWHHENS